MKKVKIHPLIIVALFINTLGNGFSAYRLYGDDRGAAIALTVLCLFTLTLAVYGIFRNRKINEK
ncbi:MULTISPECIES: hypothetical protein [Oceanobacillus]|uniref:hypothetical protein n=1 Tax=Oceanobacillus TaxID=182709 RepID=UPI00211641F9|nr:hypothetical protein [Oceanobacillus oncorhynchi]UUI41810.1 hypothetical protein NP440_09925 [Oceanobacillus oncorhynchi]